MNTANNNTQTVNCESIAMSNFNKLAEYTATLKFGSTYKGSRKVMKSQRTLMNIMHYNGVNGQYALHLTPKDSTAWGLNYHEDTVVCVHYSPIDGTFSIMPLCSPNAYNGKLSIS
jgi:hypothetical protein